MERKYLLIGLRLERHIPLSREHHVAVVDAHREDLERVEAGRIDVVFAVDDGLFSLVHQADGLLLVIPGGLATHADRPVPVHADEDLLGLGALIEHSLDADGHLLAGVGVNERAEETGVDGSLHALGHVDTRDEDVRELVVDKHRVPTADSVDGVAEVDGQLQGHEVVAARITGLPLQPHVAAGFIKNVLPEGQHVVPGLLELHRRIVGLVQLPAGPGGPPDVDARAEPGCPKLLGTGDGFDVQSPGHLAVGRVPRNHAATLGAFEAELRRGHRNPARKNAVANAGLEVAEADGARRVVLLVLPDGRLDFEKNVAGTPQLVVAGPTKTLAESLDGDKAVLDRRDAGQYDSPAKLGVTRPRAQRPCGHRVNPFRCHSVAPFSFYRFYPSICPNTLCREKADGRSSIKYYSLITRYALIF